MMKIIEFIFRIQIMLSPILAMTILGFIAKIYFDNSFGEAVLIFSIIAGTVLGIIWSRKIRKKNSYSTFYSKVNASPDLDDLEKK